MSVPQAVVALSALAFSLVAIHSRAMSIPKTQQPSTAPHEHLVATCLEVPPGEKRPEFGCFIVATAK